VRSACLEVGYSVYESLSANSTMADRTTIQRIAKILARASSDNAGEAETALRGALGRMKRDGVSFKDLLSLPVEELYQDTLVKLIELLVQERTELSHSSRRDLYSTYLKLIVAKFSNASTKEEDEATSGGQGSREQSDREAQREEYVRRTREEEARRNRSSDGGQSGSSSGNRGYGSRAGGQWRQHGETPKSSSGFAFWSFGGKTQKLFNGLPLKFEPSRYPLRFSIENFFAFLFGERSFFLAIITNPARAVLLLLVSFFVAGIVCFAVASLIKFGLPNFVALQSALSWLMLKPGKLLSIVTFIAAYAYYERGWFYQRPSPGQTTVLAITRDIVSLIQAILWRCYGLILLLGNVAYIVGTFIGQKIVARRAKQG
jgi:hypothetical protein